MAMSSVPELLEELRQGRMIILVDDEDRENEGDLVASAQHITPEQINFMAKEARGLICLSLDEEQVRRLGLRPMVEKEANTSPHGTAFLVSIEASQGVTTGISAADRAHTVRVASAPNAQPQDVRSPGHIFPLRAQPGGVLKRAGHTEGSVDLMKLAGLWPAAVICEIMNSDGSMARLADLEKFSQKFKLKMGTIEDLIRYRLEREILVREIWSQELLIRGEAWRFRVFESTLDGVQHVVLQKGHEQDTPLIRIVRDNYFELLWDTLNHESSRLLRSWERLSQENAGLLVILRGHGSQKSVWRPGDEFTMDSRDYGLGAQILKACGVKKFRLLTNHPEKRIGIRSFGLEIVDYLSVDKA